MGSHPRFSSRSRSNESSANRSSSHRCTAVIRIREGGAGAAGPASAADRTESAGKRLGSMAANGLGSSDGKRFASKRLGSSGAKQGGPALCRHGARRATSAAPGRATPRRTNTALGQASAPESEEDSGATAVAPTAAAVAQPASAVARGLMVSPLPRAAAPGGTLAGTGGRGARAAGAARASGDPMRPSATDDEEALDSGPGTPAGRPRQDDLDVTSWLAYVGTLIEGPYEDDEAPLICREPMSKRQLAALARWRGGQRPSLWSADRFLTKLRNTRHIDEYFSFCDTNGLQAWAVGFPPAWMESSRSLAQWTDEIEDDDPIWRARSDERKRQLVGRRQALLAELEAEGGAIWWNGPPRRRSGPRWEGGDA